MKVISFSLWGDTAKYNVGAVKNAELALTIYPDWKCRFYMDPSVPISTLQDLEKLPNTEIVLQEKVGDWTSLFWRFQTCYDPSVEVSIFRDTDSRLNMREKYAVDEWLKSDKTFHIMRDHPYHGFPILGGMWGFKQNPQYNIQKLIAQFTKTNSYGTDYQFFSKVLFPLIGDDKMVHDEFFENSSFPTARENQEFVGDVFDENDNRHPEYYKHIICKKL